MTKLIGLALFLLPISILTDLESFLDPNSLAEQHQITLNVIESAILAENAKDMMHFDDANYDLKEETQDQIIFNISSSLHSNSNISTYESLVLNLTNGKAENAELHYDKCKIDQVQLEWKDEVIKKISFANNTYQVEYNEAGKVRKLQLSKFTKNNKRMQKAYYLYEYTTDEKISSIKKYIAVSNSKKKSKVNEDWKYLSQSISFTYLEEGVDVMYKHYMDKRKASERYREQLVNRSKIIYDDHAITRIIYATNDVNVISRVHEYLFDDHGNVSRYVESSPGFDRKMIQQYEYNELGMIIKQITRSAADDKFYSHIEKQYKYTLKEGEERSNACAYEVETSESKIDESGKRIALHNDGGTDQKHSQALALTNR